MMCVARHIITIFAYQIRINLLKPTISAFQHSNKISYVLFLRSRVSKAVETLLRGNKEGGTRIAATVSLISCINKCEKKYPTGAQQPDINRVKVRNEHIAYRKVVVLHNENHGQNAT